MGKYGVKIKNYKAGSIYEHNIGVRDRYDYQNAMFTNNLLMYYLLENGLIVDNNSTKDIIGIEFSYGSRSYKEECNHLKKLLKNENYTDDMKEYLQDLLTQAFKNKDLFDKKSINELRNLYYVNGVDIEYYKKNKKDKILKEEVVHYKMLYRSTGKAKKGSCIFICDRLYDKALNFIRMGVKLPQHNAPIVGVSAYSSLIASSIVDTIRINPKNILILKDVDSFFETNVISIETNDKKECVAKAIDNYKLKNTMFDGQALVDESIFPDWGDGYILLRHHFCKMAGFKTKIQKFFMDYYGDKYINAKVKDMFGNEHYVKDIEVITTDNAMKWLKFDVSYDYWCDRVFENNCTFGIVKTAHKSKLGDVQKMSYQMINSLNMDIMPNVVEKSKEYIELLKKDNKVFIEYLKDNQNFSNDYEVLVALCEQNWDFTRSEYFRDRKKAIIRVYIDNLKFGKVIQNGDNLVFVGSPYAMLLHALGEDVENDDTFQIEKDSIQCFTTRFENNEFLACFRSPHNSRNNIMCLHNVYNDIYFKYFDLGNQILVLNTLHTDIQDRANGCDFDSDCGYTTNQKDIVKHAKQCYENFPTIVNNIPQDTNQYDNTLENYALIDNKLANAQQAIGYSSNLAQISQTYMYNFKDQKYIDYVCILSVLAQIAIDNAKRTYDIDLVKEISRIEQDLEIQKHLYPTFWKHIKDKKIKDYDKKFKKQKINRKLICPMNYLMDLKFKDSRDNQSTLSMDYFFKKFELEENRRKSKKVEELISKYSLQLYQSTQSNDNEYTDYGYINTNDLLLRTDFDELIEDIKTIYISKEYIGLMSWLVDRAFLITPSLNQNKSSIDRQTHRNKSILLKVLYNINSCNILKIFSKNI